MKLQRDSQTDARTFGQFIRDDGQVQCQTIELPWKDNAHSISCIPAGSYLCKRRWSPKHGAEVFGIEGVPDRSDIEIHVANDVRDLLGCVGVGTERGTLEVEPGVVLDAVLHSKTAYDAFMALWAGVDSFPLDVEPVPLP